MNVCCVIFFTIDNEKIKLTLTETQHHFNQWTSDKIPSLSSHKIKANF